MEKTTAQKFADAMHEYSDSMKKIPSRMLEQYYAESASLMSGRAKGPTAMHSLSAIVTNAQVMNQYVPELNLTAFLQVLSANAIHIYTENKSIAAAIR